MRLGTGTVCLLVGRLVYSTVLLVRGRMSEGNDENTVDLMVVFGFCAVILFFSRLCRFVLCVQWCTAVSKQAWSGSTSPGEVGGMPFLWHIDTATAASRLYSMFIIYPPCFCAYFRLPPALVVGFHTFFLPPRAPISPLTIQPAADRPVCIIGAGLWRGKQEVFEAA